VRELALNFALPFHRRYWGSRETGRADLLCGGYAAQRGRIGTPFFHRHRADRLIAGLRQPVAAWRRGSLARWRAENRYKYRDHCKHEYSPDASVDLQHLNPSDFI
jgi:hypothetical protein